MSATLKGAEALDMDNEIGSIEIDVPLGYIMLAITWGLIVPCLFYVINKLESNE